MPTQNTIDGKKIPPSLQQIAQLVKLMDSQFRVPFTKITFGLDPVIGLIPGLGDLIDYGISAFILITMVRNGASSKSVAKMILNITMDGIVGLIPVLGHIFDVFYKANRRNLVLAVEHFEGGQHQGSAWAVILPILAVLGLIFIFLAVMAGYIMYWIVQLFKGAL